MIDYQRLCLEVCGIARSAGAFIRRERGQFKKTDIESKAHNNFVSYVDKQAEKQIVAALGKLLPNAGFVTEEGTAAAQGKERHLWIIDPLDGTTNFIHGLFPYSTSIALMEDGRAAAGVVYEVGLDECFYAWQGGGAYCNGNAIRVSDARSVKDSLIITGFPYLASERYKGYMEALIYLQPDSHGLRRLGSGRWIWHMLPAGAATYFFSTTSTLGMWRRARS